MLEQKVWIDNAGLLYPNLYVFLVGHPGVGKTRSIMAARAFVNDLPNFYIAPTSMTMAALVDCLVEAKRSLMNPPEPPTEFNSMAIFADELSAFMHKFEEEIIGGLTTFYDVNVPYGQHRRGKEIRIKIKRPQLSILSGTTPTNLMKFMPEFAWSQGFCSRVIMVFADDRIINDAFTTTSRALPRDMLGDIARIHLLHGQFSVTQDFKDAVNAWRKGGEEPSPTHPKLLHYATRRFAHLLKLCMISSADRGDSLLLTMEDLSRAMGWLLEAEAEMPDIFKAGGVGADAAVQDEIYHYLLVGGQAKGLMEHQITNFARQRMPVNSVERTLKVMEAAGLIKSVSFDKLTGLRRFVAIPKN